MLRAEVSVLLLLLLVACDGADPSGADAGVDLRERVLALCEQSCVVRAAGEGCTSDAYETWCIEVCDTREGVLPEDCLDEAEAALSCWIEEEWYCAGETSYYGVEQPLPVDPAACAEETDAFYACA